MTSLLISRDFDTGCSLAWLPGGILVLSFLCVFARAQAAPQPQQLSPSEALRWAMDPFDQARSQNGDLTDADKVALSLGEMRAAHDCFAITSAPQPAPLDPAELLALGKLCLFGQQFEPARATLVNYLALPSPPERETALILLSRAFLGLKSPGSAAIQVLSLIRDYPYDAEVHNAADQAISATEDLYPNPMPGSDAIQLCWKQLGATLPLLSQGKPLQGKDEIVRPARLFNDALRCTSLAGDAGDPAASQLLDQLETILEQPNWQGTADLSPMEAAMARSRMTRLATPLRVVHAQQLGANQVPAARTLALGHGIIILAFFTLWSPSAIEAIRGLADAAPNAAIYAVTSWRANTGEQDAASPQLLSALRQMLPGLPRKVPLLVAPDAVLNAFHLDQFPAAVVISNGTVASNVVLSDAGSIRMALHGVQPSATTASKSNLKK